MTFLDFIRSCGVVPPDGLTPGRWQRCSTLAHPRKKNGSIKINDDQTFGWVQDFSTMHEPVTWQADKAQRPVYIDQAEIASRAAARRREIVMACTAARIFYDSCEPLLNGHTYLINKGLGMSGCHGLKVDDKGWLVVPMYYNGRVCSVQRISEDGDKRFWLGATTKATSYVLDCQTPAITLLTEGLATGLTLRLAVPDARVIVAFNSGNLIHLAGRIKVTGMAAICADNDHETEQRIGKNPGIEAGTAAAALLNCGLAYPECDGTDFNDLFQECMKVERQNNLFRSGHKLSVAEQEKEVHATIRAVIMRKLVYVPPA